MAAYEMQEQLNAVEVRGNNEEKPFMYERLARIEQDCSRWLTERLPLEAQQRLVRLPLTASLDDDRLLVAHGTTESSWLNLLWKLQDDALVERDEKEVLLEAAGLPDSVQIVVVGHTHKERIVQAGGRLLVNAGPVSWQTDGDPRARWTLLTRTGDTWQVDQRRVEYDWDAASLAVLANSPVLPVEAAAHVEGIDGRFAELKRLRALG